MTVELHAAGPDEPSVPLALQMSEAVYAVSLAGISAGTLEHVKVILIDALGCLLAANSSVVDEAVLIADGGNGVDTPEATILRTGRRMGPGEAALVNGALLRSMDLMDVYAGEDVCHPSEIIPAALAAAEASGASGRAFLEALAAGLCLHVLLSQTIPMHDFGLHHTGHGALVVPLITGRLSGLSPQSSAATLNLMSEHMLLPEGFSRGDITNLKTYAYGLRARACFEVMSMSRSGLSASTAGVEETLRIWTKLSGRAPDFDKLTGRLDTEAINSIWMKQYPAQYALQPLIASAILARQSLPDIGEIESIAIKASRRTVERCADRAKFRPKSAEAADHSLPFCVAVALIDSKFDVSVFGAGRWEHPDVLGLMGLMMVEAVNQNLDYSVGPQEIVIRFKDGTSVKHTTSYPPQNTSWRDIAVRKIKMHGGGRIDADQVVSIVDELDTLPSVAPLVQAMIERASSR